MVGGGLAEGATDGALVGIKPSKPVAAWGLAEEGAGARPRPERLGSCAEPPTVAEGRGGPWEPREGAVAGGASAVGGAGTTLAQ